MNCIAAFDVFALGFKAAFLVAAVAFLFGHIFPLFIKWLHRSRSTPPTAAQLESFRQRFNVRMDKRIAKAKQRELENV